MPLIDRVWEGPYTPAALESLWQAAHRLELLRNGRISEGMQIRQRIERTSEQ